MLLKSADFLIFVDFFCVFFVLLHAFTDFVSYMNTQVNFTWIWIHINLTWNSRQFHLKRAYTWNSCKIRENHMIFFHVKFTWFFFHVKFTWFFFTWNSNKSKKLIEIRLKIFTWVSCILISFEVNFTWHFSREFHLRSMLNSREQIVPVC